MFLKVSSNFLNHPKKNGVILVMYTMMHVFTHKETISESLSNLLRVHTANLERFTGKGKLEKDTEITLMIYPHYEIVNN